MVSRIVSYIFCCGMMLAQIHPIWAQRSDTVFYQVATNTQVAAQVALPPSANIGQPYHLVLAVFSDALAHTCSNVTTSTVPPLVDIWAGGSTDQNLQAIITNYARIITPNGGSPTNRYRMLVSAAGSYPFLSIQFQNWDTVNCKVSVLYTGSLSSIDIKKYADFGTFNDRLQTFTISTSFLGDTLIVPSVCADCRITVYGLILYNPTGGQSIVIKDSQTGTNFITLTSYCAGCQLALPNTNYPLLTTTTGGGISMSLSAATPVTGFISFRVE